eukprot:TRINITY_DN51249_c0_g1_i1.p1 TRINITY_DN51249_c0_g1~~TRINITY_DN51249_c0_g1_i1.p1  ORF type:complete len:687 (+),score=181.63 TRINITY_DN51249_c0_g1_i1:86-2062(+)
MPVAAASASVLQRAFTDDLFFEAALGRELSADGSSHHRASPNGGFAAQLLGRQVTEDFGVPREKSAFSARSFDSGLTAQRRQSTTDYACRGLTPAQLRMLEEKFAAADTSGDGVLTQDELYGLWSSVFPHLTTAQTMSVVAAVFGDMDSDGGGTITFAELSAYLTGEVSLTRDGDDDLGEEAQATSTKERPTGREWLWAVLEAGYSERFAQPQPLLRWVSLAWAGCQQLIILLSIVNMMAETYPSLQHRVAGANCTLCDGHDITGSNAATAALETFCVAVFTLEFTGRLLGTPSQRAYWGDPFTWIDIMSLLPFYLTHTGTVGESSRAESLFVLRVLRMLKLARVLRVMRLGRRAHAIHLITVSLRRSGMALVWGTMVTAMCVTLFGALLYYVEREGAVFDPEREHWVRPADSIYSDHGQDIFMQSMPDALWLSLVTLTTVGYGDLYPVTELGKAVGGLAAFVGLLIVAFPITILTSAYQRTIDEWMWQRQAEERQRAVRIAVEQGLNPPEEAGDNILFASPLIQDAEQVQSDVVQAFQKAAQRTMRQSVGLPPAADDATSVSRPVRKQSQAQRKASQVGSQKRMWVAAATAVIKNKRQLAQQMAAQAQSSPLDQLREQNLTLDELDSALDRCERMAAELARSRGVELPPLAPPEVES